MDEANEINPSAPKREKIRVIPLSAIDDAPDHPFVVRDDEEMAELTESISTFGVINPVIVRRTGDERYEMISGHRRKYDDMDKNASDAAYALRSTYLAYVEAGFTEDQAFELIAIQVGKHPENFVPNASNTIVDEFLVSERFPDFDDKLALATKWWNDHILTGISPEFDEKADAEILKILRTNTVSADSDIQSLLAEAETLAAEIEDLKETYISEKEARLAEVKDMIKQYAIQQFRPDDKKVEFRTQKYIWSVGRSVIQTVDKTALKKDGLLDKYTKATESYKLNPPTLIKTEE